MVDRPEGVLAGSTTSLMNPRKVPEARFPKSVTLFVMAVDDLLHLLGQKPGWQDQAACRGATAKFFPLRGESARTLKGRFQGQASHEEEE